MKDDESGEERRDHQREIESYLSDLEQSLLEATVHESQLEEALVTRALIGEAMGILMIQNDCTAKEAFETLKQVSQHSNIKLRDIAARLVGAAEGSGAANVERNITERDDRG